MTAKRKRIAGQQQPAAKAPVGLARFREGTDASATATVPVSWPIATTLGDLRDGGCGRRCWDWFCARSARYRAALSDQIWEGMQPHLAVLHEAHDPNSLLDVYEVAEETLSHWAHLPPPITFERFEAAARAHLYSLFLPSFGVGAETLVFVRLARERLQTGHARHRHTI